MKKVISILFITFFVGFIALGALLQTEAVREYAKKTLIEKIHAETGYRVEIEDIRLYPSFQMRAIKGTLYDKDLPLLSFDHLHVGIYPLELKRGILHLSTLQIEGVKLIGSGTQERPFSLEDVPYKLKIDRFEIRYISQESPLVIKGNLYLDPKNFQISTHVTLFPKKDLEKWVSGDISYKKGNGSFQLNSVYNVTLNGEYLLASDATWRIPHFHGSYGVLDLDGNLSMAMDGKITDSSLFLSSGDLSQMLPLTGQFHGSGKILGYIMSPELDLSLESDSIDFQGNTFEKVKINIISRQTEKGLKGDLDLSFVKDQQPHSFSGKISWDETLGPLPTHLRAKTHLTEIAQLLAMDLTDVEGQINIDLEISDKRLTTHAELTNGIFESFEFGTLLTNVHAIAEGDLHQLTLKEITAGDGNGGEFSGSGTVALDPQKGFPLDLAFQMKKASIVQLDNTKATASGQFTIKGPWNKAKLKGKATTQSIRIKLPEKIPALKDTLEITYINQPPGEDKPTSSRKKGLVWPLDLDIKLKVPGNAKVKGRGLSSEWKGEVAITGTPASPLVHGEFKIVEGKYLLRGKTFRINNGSLTLAGDPEKKAALYIIAEIKIDRITAEAIVKGPIRNPGISFRSTPPMPKREILSWILFNKGVSDISPFQGTQLNQSMTTLSTGTDDGPDIMSRIGNTLGLDRIEIGGSPGKDGSDVSVQIGKYLSDSTYVSFTRKRTNKTRSANQTTEANCVGVETTLGKHVTLQAEVDDDSGGQVNLLWKKDY